MSIDIGRYINYLLFQRGAITLRGIGTISVIRDPAHFSGDEKEILPPKTRYTFSENTEDQQSLINTIENNEKIDAEAAMHYVSKYCEDILNKLLNYNIVKVGDIGFLEKETDKTIFIPSEATLKRSYFGLPAIPVTKVDKKPPAIAVTAVTTSQIKTDESKKDKHEWVNYVGALILGALMVVAYHYFLDPHPNMPSFNNSKMDIGVVAPPEDMSSDTIAEGDQPGEESSDILVSDSSSVSPSDDKEDTSSVKIAEPKAETECIIIVGVYNRTITALQMSDRLKEDGYTPYRDDHFDTQRVGIRFRCSDYDLQEIINTMRRKYSRNSWYLVPQISM